MIPRCVKRIVFGYTVDCFPGLLIVGCNQLKRKIERAGFDVAVSMEPLTALPTDTDILCVPPELLKAAQQTTDCRIEVIDHYLNHPTYNTVIAQLKAGHEWTAARRSERMTSADDGEIMTYRGYERIG